MKVIKEINLRDFPFWSGAVITASLLSSSEFEAIEQYLEELFPDGAEETLINDFFWFDDEEIAIYLGYKDFDELYNERINKLKS